MKLYYTNKEHIFCTEDGKEFFKMVAIGVFKPLSDEECEELEKSGCIADDIYIPHTREGTIEALQEFINENEENIIKFNFSIVDSFECFLNKGFKELMNNLHNIGVAEINILVDYPHGADGFKTNFFI